jgi:aspartate/tyrosine/aromatic aminotransferase
MFHRLALPPQDPILQVMAAFAADPRGDKVDLGVGVYRDDSGITPVMRAVKTAEMRLVQTQPTKAYTGMTGTVEFQRAFAGLVLGGVVQDDRLAVSATTGGSGAVRMIFDLIKRATPDATVWIPQPSWPMHVTMAQAAGLNWRPWRLFDAENGALDRDAMFGDLAQIAAGDVVLLHGCCHNPTGVELAAQDWADIAALMDRTGAVPFVDIAYQGFGAGLDADAGGLRHLAARLPVVLVAASAAKNFGLYRERAGAAMVICDPAQRATVTGAMSAINRSTYGFPPDHGAQVVTTILNDPALRLDWQDELDTMRDRVLGLRRALADALRAETGSDRFGCLADQAGMFSILPLDDTALARLRQDHGVYLVGGGRMNVAGLRADTIPRVARALAQVL